MIELSIPVPPDPILEDALGYTGDARLLSIYWTPAGDEAMLDDGLESGDGHPWGYLAYVHDQRVAMGIVAALDIAIDLGSSDSDHTHRLVIDRQTRIAYLATEAEAVDALAAQWPPPPPMTPAEQEEVLASFTDGLRRAMADYTPPTPAEVKATMDAQRAAVDRLRQWLDASTRKNGGNTAYTV